MNESGELLIIPSAEPEAAERSRTYGETNCKNCGAPLNFKKPKCEYCSTAIIEETEQAFQLTVYF